MNPNITIRNFRVFDNNGVSFELAPITILTGCNSSGKSSFVKSLLLLDDYFAGLKFDDINGKRIDLTAHKLDFTKSPHSSLGKFSKVVNKKSEGDSVSFGIQTHSDMFGQDVYLELVFAAGESDTTNGYIKSITINKVDGTMIYHSDVEGKSIGNLYDILDEFICFVYTQHFISYYELIDDNRHIGDGDTMPNDEFKKLEEELRNHINDIQNRYGKEVILDINRWNNSNNRRSFLSNVKVDPRIMKDVKEYGILYYIPFIGEKLKGRKDEVCTVLEECKQSDDIDKATASILDKIIKDFKASTFDSFIEYYKNWEKKYLTGYKMWKYINSPSKYPNIPDARRIGLSANTITMSPYNTVVEDWDNPEPDRPSEEEIAMRKAEEIAQWEAAPLSFEAIFEALCILSMKYCSKEQLYFDSPEYLIRLDYSSKTERLFLAYVEEAIKEIVVNAMPNTLSYISSSVINVKRLYPLELTDEFTQVLKRFIEAKRNLDMNLDYMPNTFFNKWVKAFGIGEKITLNVDPEGLGVTLRLHKDDADTEGTLLADNGYGITQLFALLLNIEVCIMERTVHKKYADNSIVSISHANKCINVVSSPTIAVEEPEIHLHPNMQSKLADMFCDAYINYGIKFIIETHSEYLIRKFQTFVYNNRHKTQRDSSLRFMSNDDISLYYLYKPHAEVLCSDPQVKRIQIKEDGCLDTPFGPGFFDESDNLSLELYGIK